MTNLNLKRVRKQLQKFDFKTLFIDELGWEHHRESDEIVVDGTGFSLSAVAEKRGLVVLLCCPEKDSPVPLYAVRRKIERKVARTWHQHLIIYTDNDQTMQIWQWVRRETGKPDACREHRYQKGQPGDGLIQKLDKLAVSLDEEESITHVEMVGRTRAAFNVERITKKFFDRFKTEHTVFLGFIEGIKEQGSREWYASLMLNRLMFVYFIQKKGFLDGDTNYLRNRLQRLREQSDSGTFHSFYRHFLLRLFHEGLGAKKDDRKPELDKLLGRVPYLNGGLFDVHELEREYDAIQIPDEAFITLFDFFEQYQWHLDERPLRQDNEINPDVLGYIFEKYINQKQMGAYYTREDITEYIAKNTIIPYLFDAARKKCRIAFQGEQSLWKLLHNDPDRYIYEAVCKGCELELPENIAAGLDDVAGRTDWNTPAPEEYALPTEIWREVVARRKRYAEVRDKLAAGELRSINDLITHNLNIRQFAQDVIENCEGPELLRAFWQAIVGRIPKKSNEPLQHGITILDPTCGSGAFLFAALNILEPLYEACLDRMQVFVAELGIGKEKPHPEKYSDFRKELERVASHPNQLYFIMKSIILNNLYGVDIMAEAVEICKLRLFLKMVAQLERVEEVEPLPDIDFNIRCGNTLVGFITQDEVRDAITMTTKAGASGKQMTLTGMHDPILKTIEQKAQDLQQAFNLFRRRQVEGDGSVPHEDKQELRRRLKALKDDLNKGLAVKYGINSVTEEKKYQQWLESHKPFHWFIEYYGIMTAGGFDVIIGNPPYLEKSKLKDSYTVKNYSTEKCRDIYSWVVERVLSLRKKKAIVSLIVPVSLASSGSFQPLRELFNFYKSHLWFSHFANRPGQLFSGAQNRLTIFIFSETEENEVRCSTRYYRWHSRTGERDALFPKIKYVKLGGLHNYFNGLYPKIGDTRAYSVVRKILSNCACKKSLLSRSDFPVYWVRVPGYFCQFFLLPPMATSEKDGSRRIRGEVNQIYLENDITRRIFFSVLNSSAFFQFFCAYTDGRHINPSDVKDFPFDCQSITNIVSDQLVNLSNKLNESIHNNTKKWRKSGLLIDSVESSQTKPIIDKIDQVLAQHYGFTDEELDFIINYDIKYRMGIS